MAFKKILNGIREITDTTDYEHTHIHTHELRQDEISGQLVVLWLACSALYLVGCFNFTIHYSGHLISPLPPPKASFNLEPSGSRAGGGIGERASQANERLAVSVARRAHEQRISVEF